MPELPQIEPIDVGLSKPIVQTPPGQIGSQIAAFAEKTQDQALELGKQAAHMNRYINFHTADAEYMTKSANIFDATRTITDPDVQFATRQRVLGQLKDEVAAKYPAAGPELGPQLTLRSAEDVRRAKLESTALSVQNAKDNLDAAEEPSIVAATAAPTQADADTIKQGFHDTVNQAAKLGQISLGDANKRIAKYDYNLQFAMVTKLGMENPQAVLRMKPEESGLRPQDLSLIQWRVGGIMQRNDSTAKREFEGVQNQNDDAIFNGKITDPGVINDLHRKGMVSTEGVKYGTGAEPTNPAVAGPILNYINTAPDMTPNEWRHYKADTVARNKFLEPSDREAANSAIEARISDGETKLGQLKKTYMADIKLALRHKYPGSIGSNSNPKQMALYAHDEEAAIARLDGAKSFEDLDNIHKDILKNSAPVRHAPILSDAEKAKKLMDALGVK